MPKMIFINLPVTDLSQSVAFYEAIGGRKEPKFSNDQAAMIVLSDTISVMLLTHGFYKTFTGKPIADAHQSSQVLLCLSADSKADVDAIIAKASAARHVSPIAVRNNALRRGLMSISQHSTSSGTAPIM